MEVSGRKATKGKETASRETDQLCEPCKDAHVKRRAKGACRDCKEFMCNTCFKHHLKARQCRNHVLINASNLSVSLDRGVEDSEKCRHHENVAIKYYCRTHDIVGCSECMMDGHSACKPELINDISNDFPENEDFKHLVRKLVKLTSAIKDHEKKIQVDKREVKTMHEMALKDIRKFRKDMNDYLDKAEGDVITALNRLKSANENLLTKLGNDCKLLSSKIDDVKTEINEDIYRGKELFIHSIECKPEVLDIECAIAKLQVENEIDQITFVPDKLLLNIIASKTKLGDLDCPKRIKPVADQSKHVTGEKEVARLNSESTGASARSFPEHEVKKVADSRVELVSTDTEYGNTDQKDEVVLETFFHRSGKEFKCIYQSGMRFYLDDWGSKEWQPFPKRWYNEGLLKTNDLNRP